MRTTMTLVLAGVVGLCGMMRAQAQPAHARVVEITAKKYEFDARKIEVKAGETLELHLTSLDAKHGFECKDLGVQKVTFEKGKPATVTFTAGKPGTYEFKCASFCGMGHGKMKGEIVVTPR
ncbi:MAG: cupredoxin domain-containing protein [Vicinamibacterales bacterium]|nr:cupredoxin domain-containing protein [Vicinamibacterales bacterium]